MCNAYKLELSATQIFDELAGAGVRIVYPEGIPNIAARTDIRITDVAPIVRTAGAGAGAGAGELVQRRWSWPGPSGKPVYNFRSDGRAFGAGRCLIPVDGFYEYTTPADPKKKLKDKWLFTKPGEPLFCIAGLWRADPKVGEAFTMLTMPPGPDVARFHDRQVAVLDRADWAGWLDLSVSAKDLLRPLPAGSLAVAQVG